MTTPGTKLPRHYLITGESDSEENWWAEFSALLGVGDSFIQFRSVSQDMENPARWAKKALRLARQAGRQVVLNGEPDTAMLLDMDGVHLPSRLLMRLRHRPLPANRLVGASCHNVPEIRHAEQIDVDFICLSPVFPTSSHPGTRALGMKQFEAMTSICTVPVFALGGLGKTDLQRVQDAGGYGIAGISAYWGASGS